MACPRSPQSRCPADADAASEGIKSRGGQLEHVPDQVGIVVKKTVRGLALPLQAGGQWFAVAKADPPGFQPLGNGQNKGGLAAVGLCRADQQGDGQRQDQVLKEL